MGATYYFYKDATGTSDGLSEANAYDGTSTATLPDGSSAVCKLGQVIKFLQSGDILWIKKSTTDIDFGGASITTASQSTDGPTNFVDGGTSYGQVRIYGYDGTTGDGGRPTIDLGGKTWQHKRKAGIAANLNFHGTYTGAGIVQVDTGAAFINCRIENTSTASNAIACKIINHGFYDRCEMISNASIANPTSNNDCTVYINTQMGCSIINCYIESRNGVNGIFVQRTAGSFTISNNIIVTNLDVDGAGNNSGYGVRYQSPYPAGGTILHNIFHNGGVYLDRSSSGDTNRGGLLISQNIFSSCTNAIDGHASFNAPAVASDSNTNNKPPLSVNNVYWANTSNSFLNREVNPTFLSADPFVDFANKDFTITASEVLDNITGLSNFSTSHGPGISSSDVVSDNALLLHQPSAATTLPTIVSVF